MTWSFGVVFLSILPLLTVRGIYVSDNTGFRLLYFYKAYELGIHSQIPLPELVAVDSVSEDVTIRVRQLDTSERIATRNGAYCLGEADGVGTFLVRGGKEIIAEPVPGVEESLLCTTLLGAGMALLLRQRGLAVLHASGIVINGGTVAFLGQSGFGKSTLAEAFYSHGYGVITDDVMGVHLDGPFPEVIPGYPFVKLFPHAAALLGADTRPTHRLNSQTEKRSHCVRSRFPHQRVRLQKIYVLAFGECNQIAPLSAQETFLELARNSRAVGLLRDSDSRHEHLQQCTRLAAAVPVFRLTRRPALTALPELVGLIEKDLAQ